MGFIELFLKKDAKHIIKNDIVFFVSRRIEENLNLDYKHIKAYFNFDKLSQDVSAFANSQGGLLVLGVNEEKIGKGKKLRILPKEITWGDVSLSKEQLEDNLIAKIHPRINGLRIVPVREGNGSLMVIFLVDIPQSDNPPHMASDNRYYKRLNFRKVPMEHYEVSDLFGKRRRPFLSLILQLIEIQIKDSIYQFRVRFSLQNIGKAIAKYVQMSASFYNLEIISTSGALRSESTDRIDHLREGIPSIQYNAGERFLYYPTIGLRTSIGEITFKVLDNKNPIKIRYHLIAEDMELFIDEIDFTTSKLDDAKKMIDQGQSPFLKNFQ